MRGYTSKGVLMPTPALGLVHFGGAALTPDEARLLAGDLRQAAMTADADSA
jgi:hypothetical protein